MTGTGSRASATTRSEGVAPADHQYHVAIPVSAIALSICFAARARAPHKIGICLGTQDYVLVEKGQMTPHMVKPVSVCAWYVAQHTLYEDARPDECDSHVLSYVLHASLSRRAINTRKAVDTRVRQ